MVRTQSGMAVGCGSVAPSTKKSAECEAGRSTVSESANILTVTAPPASGEVSNVILVSPASTPTSPARATPSASLTKYFMLSASQTETDTAKSSPWVTVGGTSIESIFGTLTDSNSDHLSAANGYDSSAYSCMVMMRDSGEYPFIMYGPLLMTACSYWSIHDMAAS